MFVRRKTVESHGNVTVVARPDDEVDGFRRVGRTARTLFSGGSPTIKSELGACKVTAAPGSEFVSVPSAFVTVRSVSRNARLAE